MKRNFLFFSSILIILSPFLLFSSCNKKQEIVYEKIKPRRVIKNNILVILGKDYYTRTDILKYLKEEYKLGTDDSYVQVLTYSDMVKNSRLPRLRMITEKIEEQKSTIVISVGIPEGAGKYLIQAANDNPNLTIITLLPMDEILPLEAASDIVVDFQIPKGILSEEKDFAISDNELMLLLVSAIFAGEDMNAHNKQIKIFPIEEFRQAFFTTQQVLGKELFNSHYTIKPYLDSDTGIQSHRYLLIYRDIEDINDTYSNNDNNLDEDIVDDEEAGDITNPDKLEGGA